MGRGEPVRWRVAKAVASQAAPPRVRAREAGELGAVEVGVGDEVRHRGGGGVAEEGGGEGAGELREVEAGEGDEAAAVGKEGEHEGLGEDGEVGGPGEAGDAEGAVERPVERERGSGDEGAADHRGRGFRRQRKSLGRRWPGRTRGGATG